MGGDKVNTEDTEFAGKQASAARVTAFRTALWEGGGRGGEQRDTIDVIAPEGKAREGEEEEASPPQRSAEPKKTIPGYKGEASALYDLLSGWALPGRAVVDAVNELIDACIDLRYQVRPLVRVDTIH